MKPDKDPTMNCLRSILRLLLIALLHAAAATAAIHADGVGAHAQRAPHHATAGNARA
jgi:hypothetical protein